MSNILVAFFALLIDRVFGEFSFIKHPIILIGELITSFEANFYKDSVLRGFWLVCFVLSVVGFFSIAISLYLELFNDTINILFSSLIASLFIAHRMLYDSVKNILTCKDKKEALSMLVSRDVEPMSESDIYKASIETYAENLSDGLIAPLFYLLFFGLTGIIIYKTINTMDSMVGYKNEKYKNYGKVAARLDDIVNLIPSRLSALFIMLVSAQKSPFSFYKMGKKHESPNAGHPITAIALALHVKLGGDTYYFLKLKKKPYFGIGKESISAKDLKKALLFRDKIDLLLVGILIITYFLISSF